MANPNSYDAIILGAGAAGLMCAAVAGQRGKRVLLIDHADRPGKKILISGGGRCNFTNLGTVPDRFISANPHFAKSALARYRPRDFLDLVERHGIAWHEKTLGQLFCDGSARQIVDMLVGECPQDRVTMSLGYPASSIERGEGGYRVVCNGRTTTASALVLATGGPSIPKMGATGFAYELAKRFGLKLVEPRPALVPLTLGDVDLLFRDLSGIAGDVTASTGRTSFREAALFTHRGLSGPAILQISSYWRHGLPVTLDLLPDRQKGWLASEKRARPRAGLATVLGQAMPDRLATALTDRLALTGELATRTDRALDAAEQQLHAWTFHPTGTEGFAKAEVTVGGISTAEMSSQTMAAHRVPGLYVIGEAVDVTGWLGGYNFQWAWASGVAAGNAV